MEIYYLIVGIALCGILVSIWNNRQENKQMQENVDESHPSASASLSDHDESGNQARTRDLFLDTLIKLGCQYVHSKSTIPFLSSMPVIENYLRTELNVFPYSSYNRDGDAETKREYDEGLIPQKRYDLKNI